MTKTKCPTCGARCEAKVVHGVTLKTHMTAFPIPDLIKLREAFINLVNICTKSNLTGLNRYSQVQTQIDTLIVAVQELLEQEDK